MLPLQIINEKINNLQKLSMNDKNNLLTETQELFFMLAGEGNFFIILQESQAIYNPYIDPIKNLSNKLFLRIFSHEEIAQQFLHDINKKDMSICSLSLPETIQLAKFWFLKGVYGFILNDGGIWTTITLPDYLHYIYSSYLKNPDQYNENYIDHILFLNKLREKKGMFFYINQNQILISDKYSNNYQILSIEQLLTLCKTQYIFFINLKHLQFSTNSSQLKQAIEDINILNSSNKNLDFHIEDITLDFISKQNKLNSFQDIIHDKYLKITLCCIFLIFILIGSVYYSSFIYQNPANTKMITSNSKIITIQSINTTLPDSEGAVGIKINWKNTSGKKISKVYFTVEAFNEIGTPLKCFRNGHHSYTILAIGQFLPDYETPSSGFIYEKIWYNPGIAYTKITKIQVEYENNPRITISQM